MKEDILKSLVERDGYEYNSQNEQADKVQRYENAILLVKEYESIIKSQKKNVAYRKDLVFKRFEESENVINMVKKLVFFLVHNKFSKKRNEINK